MGLSILYFSFQEDKTAEIEDRLKRFSMLKFNYSQRDFDDLMRMMKSNVCKNLETIKECILKAVERRHTKLF